MKKSLILLTSLFIIISCGENSEKQKELELKEKELDIKQKELELKEKGLRQDSISNKLNEVSEKSPTSTGLYIVKAEKSHFFDAPDLTKIRKGYVVKGDQVEIKQIQGKFGYGSYVPSGKISGWLLLSELEKATTDAIQIKSTNNYQSFIGKWKTNSGNDKETYNISYENGKFVISLDWSKKYIDEMQRDNHMNILNNCAYYDGNLIGGVIKAKHTEGSSCDDELEIILINDNQISVSNQSDKTKIVYYRK
ncbi:MAG: hypothetical protein ABI402_05935 [Ferruginibacter sp.]